jgi:hypothetical protein
MAKPTSASNTESARRLYRRNPCLLTRRVGDCTLVCVATDDAVATLAPVTRLDRAATAVLEALDDACDLDAVNAFVAARFATAPETVASDVEVALHTFVDRAWALQQ